MSFSPHVWTRLTTSVVLLFGLIAASIGMHPVAAQAGDSSIEVHERICPTDYQGSDFFGDRHDTVTDPGMAFTFTNLDTGETWDGTTNENGNVGFANLPAGTYTITGGAPGEFADHVVYCAIGTEENANQEQVSVEYVTGGVQFDLPASTNVICDWYEVPYNLQGEPTATTPSPDVFDLPVGALLCDADPGATATDFMMTGVLPDGCEEFGGAPVTVSTPDGDLYGTCTTAVADRCFVTIDVGVTVVATIDTTTLPAGYTVVGGQTQEIEITPASEAWALFVAVPAAPEPTVEPTATTPPVAVEGRDVSILEGTCSPTETGAVVTDLTDLTRPEVAVTDDVVMAESSSSMVGFTLNELMSSDHVVIAYTDDEARTPVACTPIAGELNANGELVLGLQEVNDSGYTGIVYMRESSEGASVSVFLAEDLAQDGIHATPAPLG